MSAVARRYALAGVEAAVERGGLDAVDELAAGLRDFRTAYQSCAELHELVTNPALTGQRTEVLRQVGTKLGISELTMTLVLLLTDNERISELNEVTEAVIGIADERLARVRAQVISAVDLSSAQKERLAAALKKRVGRPVVLDITIDAAVLGGLVCKVGSYTIDSSVKRQLEIMSERLHHD